MNASTSGTTSQGAFNPKVVVAIVVAGALALLLYMVGTAYSPQFANGNNGGAHALSNSATGYSAIVDMIEEVGGESVSISRDKDTVAENSLLILTPEDLTQASTLKEALDAHLEYGPALIVLPKYATIKHSLRPGWIRKIGVIGATEDILPLKDWSLKLNTGEAPRYTAKTTTSDHFYEPLTLPLPSELQIIDCTECTAAVPIVQDTMLVAEIDRGHSVYILSDPDMLNNQGIAKKANGIAAMNLLNAIAEDSGADTITFDVTTNGFGKARSILRTLFEPPLLALTLCFLFAAILAGWQAFHRFGPALARVRDVALGKKALITTGAELMKQAGKERHGSAVYARHMRERMAQALKAPANLEEAELDGWLDRFTPPGSSKFSELMTAMIRADNNVDMVRTGAQLSRWRKDVLREH